MKEIYSFPLTSPAVTHSYFLKALWLSTFLKLNFLSLSLPTSHEVFLQNSPGVLMVVPVQVGTMCTLSWFNSGKPTTQCRSFGRPTTKVGPLGNRRPKSVLRGTDNQSQSFGGPTTKVDSLGDRRPKSVLRETNQSRSFGGLTTNAQSRSFGKPMIKVDLSGDRRPKSKVGPLGDRRPKTDDQSRSFWGKTNKVSPSGDR